jgi:hypothetical protein
MHGLRILRIQRESLLAARLSIKKSPGTHVLESGRMEQSEIPRFPRVLGPDNVTG